MTSLINAKILNEHLDLMATGLHHLMGACKAARNGETGTGTMVLIPDPENRVIAINWLNREDVPDDDIRDEVARCEPGDTSMMAIVIPHPGGGWSGYRISTMVRWTNHQAGFVVVAEAHHPRPAIEIPNQPNHNSVAQPRTWFSDLE